MTSDATVNTRVTQMKAKDPDSNAVLIYSFVQPYRAWDPNGRPVDRSVYDFTVSALSGISSYFHSA